MNKNAKSRKPRNTISTSTQSPVALTEWPPPGIDPNDKEAIKAALPWNQPSGMVVVPMDLAEPDDDAGLTLEESRRQYFITAPANDIREMARIQLRGKCATYCRKNHVDNKPALSRNHPRDLSSGTYIGTNEAFHKKIAKISGTSRNDDTYAIDTLIDTQPHRQAFAAHPEWKQPVPTYGPMMLPESRDPAASLEEDPGIEQRPTHWSPDTPSSQVIAGTVHDFGNYLSALVARQVVALGFTPDNEAIANARSLSRTLRDFQKITREIEEQHTPKPRKTSPGRPPKKTFLDPEKAITLRLEIEDRNKKFQNKKYAHLTIEKSTLEADLNSNDSESEISLLTSEKSIPEADLNQNPQNSREN